MVRTQAPTLPAGVSGSTSAYVLSSTATALACEFALLVVGSVQAANPSESPRVRARVVARRGHERRTVLKRVGAEGFADDTRRSVVSFWL